jgi:hypothetical protein
MSQNSDEEKLIQRYLLGELSENEQDHLETQLLDHPEFLERAHIIEGELLDDYVMESLSEGDRMNLESSLLMNARKRRRVELIRLLHLESNPAMAAQKRLPYEYSLLLRYFMWHRNVWARVALAAAA